MSGRVLVYLVLCGKFVLVTVAALLALTFLVSLAFALGLLVDQLIQIVGW